MANVSSKTEKNIRAVLTVSIVFILGILLIVLAIMVHNTNATMRKLQKSHITKNTTADPLANLPEEFKKMTIPSLRERSYDSSLGERTVYAENDAYTSYLTSYQSDGLRINGLLTIPTGGKPSGGWPAIVFIHGYIPPSTYVTTEKYVAYVDSLARNGYVVFKIDLRGHGESEGQAGGGYYGSDYVVDTLNAYAALKRADFINPKEIGLWGHSMAGNIVLRSMATRPEIRAAVIWAGAVYSYTDQAKYGIHDTSYRPPVDQNRQQSIRRLLFEKVGSPSATSPFWQQVAPTSYLSDLQGAIEINHAEDDDVVDIGYSRDLVARLDQTNIPHEFYEYPTGGHNILEPSFSLAMQRTVDFYNKYLK